MSTRNGLTTLAMVFAAMLCLAGQVQADVMAYWEFNDLAIGESTWNGQRLIDSSGNGRDAFFSQYSTFEAGSPDYGGTPALRFTEESDQVAFRDLYEGWRNSDGTAADWPAAGEDINFEVDESFTIETLIKTSQVGDGAIVTKLGGGSEWWLLLRDNVVQAYVEDDAANGSKVIGSTAINDDQWHHVAVVRDTTTDELRLYIDYVLDASVDDITTGSVTNDQDIRIGRTNNNDNPKDLIGDIDFVRISNDALDITSFIQPGSPDVPGDANKDGKVDGSDVTILAGNWQKGVSDDQTAIWGDGDFNGDGKVDGSDVTILAGNWQYGVNAATSAVPEPSTIALMLYGIASLLFLKRR